MEDKIEKISQEEQQRQLKIVREFLQRNWFSLTPLEKAVRYYCENDFGDLYGNSVAYKAIEELNSLKNYLNEIRS